MNEAGPQTGVARLRHRIARALWEARGDSVSGETLAQTLGVSRAAVAKHVAALRARGFAIAAAPRRGYRLEAWPDALLPEAVLPLLRSRALGHVYWHEAVCDSTNARLTQAALAGADHGATLTAERQTAGRGRRGRTWHSPKGAGLYVSVLLRPPLPPAQAPQLTLVTAVAVAETLEAVAAVRPQIKWPNDLLLQGKKVAGILLELNAEAEQVHFVVVGIGINVHRPSEPPPAAIQGTAISLETARAPRSATHAPEETAATAARLSRPQILAELLARLEDWTERYVTDGFERVRQAWRERAAYLGAPVTIHAPGGQWHGVARDVDATGALLVARPDGRLEPVLAGDVSLREA